MPVDPDLITFMSGAADKRNHSPEAFRHYLDIASLSRRFLMQTIEDWAYTQLENIASTTSFSERAPMAHLLNALDYARIHSGGSNDDEFTRNIRNATACAMCGDFRSGYCLEFYQKPYTTADTFLYGLSYICVLSLGYESKEWRALTRDDRAILYASLVRLSPLPYLLSFNSLVYSSSICDTVDKDGDQLALCSGAWKVLTSIWAAAPTPDLIIKIRGLPLKRRRLAKAFEVSPCLCQCDKKCNKRLLVKVDWLMEKLSNELRSFRESIAEDL